MKWQPIETAPKDGQAVLVFADKYRIGLGMYEPGLEQWFTESMIRINGVTHWMPLPEAP